MPNPLPAAATRPLIALALLLVVALWGWTFSLMKEPIAEYGVVAFLALRFLLGAGVLGVIAAPRLDRASLATGAVIGLVLAASYGLQTFGLRLTTATNTGLITGLFIIFTPLASRMLFGTRTPALLWAAIAASLLGLFLLLDSDPLHFSAGDLLTVGGAAGYGLHIALLDRYAKRCDATTLAATQIAVAAAIFTTWALCSEGFTWPSGRVGFAILVTGILATAVAFLVQTQAQRVLSAVETTTIIILEPVFAALCGWLLLGETLTPLQIAGAVIMFSAMILVELPAALRSTRT